MRLIALVVAVLFLPASVSAQTLTMAFDRSVYPHLGPEAPVPVELDGEPATREWAQFRNTETAFEVRGLAVRDGTLCTGQWFRPFEIAAAQSVPWDVLLVGFAGGTRTRYIVIGIRGYYEIDIGYGC